MKRFKFFCVTYFKGIAMGCSDLVPGVSGSTIALITGIYQELIDTIAAFNLHALKTLFKKGIVAAWKETNASFLVSLVAGIITAILLFSHLITYLLEAYPLFMWSFFFGLILASIWILFLQVKVWHSIQIGLALLGIAIAAVISSLPESNASSQSFSLIYIFLCGAIAIIAMILPGISGSFILLLLGAYSYMLNALHTWQFDIIITFIAGVIVGILSFTRILKWFLHHYPDATLALLTGFIAGALVKVFPWQYQYDVQGISQVYIIPIVIIIVSLALVIVLEKLSHKNEH